MSRTCPYCNSSEIDDDPSRGDATCMNCGTVLEESRIVSDVQFQETGGGGHEVIGQFVSQDRAGTGGAGQPKPESREVTYYKGKKLIQEIASQLRINQHCINTAYEFFKMCVNRNFTRGRIRSYVVASCLYMTCRLENTSHLLLDFSDVTQVNVFDLGRTLNFLTRSLKINLPTTDPCLYVLRFAIMLDFGDKQKEIVSLATRIVQRMKRDWMAMGRRPTGICGAALLLAARAYNVNRAVSDIVKVVHISETAVRKRLDEFANTASGNLTIDEFNVIDLEDCEDPPSYRESRQKRLRDSKRQEEETQIDQVTQDFTNIHEEVENALRDKMKRSPYGTKLTGYSNDESVPELRQAREVVQSELIENIYSVAENGETVEVEQTINFQQHSEIYGPSLRSLGLERENEALSLKQELLSQPSTSTANIPAASSETPLDDDDLDEIDDDEIASYILSEPEAKMKETLWMSRNGQHMEEMEKKRRAKQEEEEKERDNPKKKRRVVNKRQAINTSTLGEAVYQVAKEKRISNKINYDILKEIDMLYKSDVPSQTVDASMPLIKKSSPPSSQSMVLSPTIERPESSTTLAVQVTTVTAEAPSSLSTSTTQTTTTTTKIIKESVLSQEPVSSPDKKIPVASASQATVSQPTTTTSQPAPPPKPKTQSRYKHNRALPTAAMMSRR